MKISIIGAGAMGIALAYFLGKRNEVYLTVKKGKTELFSGLYVIFKGERHEVNAHVSDHLEKGDLTIIAVKSYDLESVFQEYEIGGNILLIQNGLSHLELSKPGMNIFYAVTTIGARRISEWVSEITGVGYFKVGGQKMMELSFLDGSGIDAEWESDIKKEIYRKAAINAIINPLTAIFRVENRFVVEDPNIREISTLGIRELSDLFNKMGYEFDIKRDVEETCSVTGRNLSSTLQDIMMGRKTEIDSITGEILRLADRFGINMPINSLLYNAVKFLEKGQK
ncbi:MAG: 2-dehydropantoate 2-reductase [Thermoplasmatales archaeon]